VIRLAQAVGSDTIPALCRKWTPFRGSAVNGIQKWEPPRSGPPWPRSRWPYTSGWASYPHPVGPRDRRWGRPLHLRGDGWACSGRTAHGGRGERDRRRRRSRGALEPLLGPPTHLVCDVGVLHLEPLLGLTRPVTLGPRLVNAGGVRFRGLRPGVSWSEGQQAGQCEDGECAHGSPAHYPAARADGQHRYGAMIPRDSRLTRHPDCLTNGAHLNFSEHVQKRRPPTRGGLSLAACRT